MNSVQFFFSIFSFELSSRFSLLCPIYILKHSVSCYGIYLLYIIIYYTATHHIFTPLHLLLNNLPIQSLCKESVHSCDFLH